MRRKTLISILLTLIFLSCAQIPLDNEPAGEEFPLSGPQRAVLGVVAFPRQMEGLTDIADLENTLYRWAEDIRLSQEELDEVRLFKGGELKFLLSHIEEDSSIYDLMILLRKKGAIFQIHQQQILDQALPGDPDLIYSQTAIQNYAEYLFEKALKITISLSLSIGSTDP
jgi:hypothetical protein